MSVDRRYKRSLKFDKSYVPARCLECGALATRKGDRGPYGIKHRSTCSEARK